MCSLDNAQLRYRVRFFCSRIWSGTASDGSFPLNPPWLNHPLSLVGLNLRTRLRYLAIPAVSVHSRFHTFRLRLIDWYAVQVGLAFAQIGKSLFWSMSAINHTINDRSCWTR